MKGAGRLCSSFCTTVCSTAFRGSVTTGEPVYCVYYPVIVSGPVPIKAQTLL